MVFNEEHVINGLHQDKAAEGMKGFFSDTVLHLKRLVEAFNETDIQVLRTIQGNEYCYPFESIDNNGKLLAYALFYPVEEDCQ